MHLSDGSGMSREVHVPFCERLQGRFLRSTHQLGYIMRQLPVVSFTSGDFLCLSKVVNKYSLNGWLFSFVFFMQAQPTSVLAVVDCSTLPAFSGFEPLPLKCIHH